ncbi:MAG: hypothetical protein MJE68_05450, partial [Proteobacteria bacterium]|nr:hypothetical protein [Pseudomonadota bacterium]
KKKGSNSSNNSTDDSTTTKKNKSCYRCGSDWDRNHMKECPAKGQECHYCGGRGHFAKVCKKKKEQEESDDTSSSSSSKKKAHTLATTKEGISYYNEDGQLRMMYPPSDDE